MCHTSLHPYCDRDAQQSSRLDLIQQHPCLIHKEPLKGLCNKSNDTSDDTFADEYESDATSLPWIIRRQLGRLNLPQKAISKVCFHSLIYMCNTNAPPLPSIHKHKVVCPTCIIRVRVGQHRWLLSPTRMWRAPHYII